MHATTSFAKYLKRKTNLFPATRAGNWFGVIVYPKVLVHMKLGLPVGKVIMIWGPWLSKRDRRLWRAFGEGTRTRERALVCRLGRLSLLDCWKAGCAAGLSGAQRGKGARGVEPHPVEWERGRSSEPLPLCKGKSGEEFRTFPL